METWQRILGLRPLHSFIISRKSLSPSQGLWLFVCVRACVVAYYCVAASLSAGAICCCCFFYCYAFSILFWQIKQPNPSPACIPCTMTPKQKLERALFAESVIMCCFYFVKIDCYLFPPYLFPLFAFIQSFTYSSTSTFTL